METCKQEQRQSITCKRGSSGRAKIIIALGPTSRSLRKHLTVFHHTTAFFISTLINTLAFQPTALQTDLTICTIYTHSNSSHRHHFLQKYPTPNLSLLWSKNKTRSAPSQQYAVTRLSLVGRFHTPRTHLPASIHRTKSSSLIARSHMSFYRGRIAWLRCLLPLGEGTG